MTLGELPALHEAEDVLGQVEQANAVRDGGFDRPTRSATSPSEPELVQEDGVGARFLDRREIFAGDVLDQRQEKRVAVVGLADDSRIVARPAARAARQRRSPAISS